uniref:Kinesin-like protein n=1 Tax=Steinernema glaseri TaxID=37863 RepID=A0A1I7ZQR1_9BILA
MLLDNFAKCTCGCEIAQRNAELKEEILETHLAVKNQLIRNLEVVIDEQEAKIEEMKNYIEGTTTVYPLGKKKILKGISLLSLDFGSLSEENLSLKEALRRAESRLRAMELNQSIVANVPITIDQSAQAELDAPVSENNNVPGKYDRNGLVALKTTVDSLKEAKNDMKLFGSLIRDELMDSVDSMRQLVNQHLNGYVSDLLNRYRREMELRKRLHNTLVELNGNIRVFCRVRPEIGAEERNNTVIHMDPLDQGLLSATTPSSTRQFRCDRVFSALSTQEEVYDEVKPVIISCLDGYNVCIFAYGQTGSGKTYTMEGPASNPGINQRSITDLFTSLRQREAEVDYRITVSMIEIYNEKIRDLLNLSKDKLAIRICENGSLDIPGLTAIAVDSIQDVTSLLNKGRNNRTTSATDANEKSSRSHAIVRVKITMVNKLTKAITTGRLNLVDLAGSERVSQSGATGHVLKEAQYINKSLSELGNVVTALRNRERHIPFRNCQLTRLLEDCLVGDSKTLMFVQLSPNANQISESISSLNFAEKISKVQTKTVASPTAESVARTLPLAKNNGRPSNFIRFNSVRQAKTKPARQSS